MKKILALSAILLASSLVSAQEPQHLSGSATGVLFGVNAPVGGMIFTCNHIGTANQLFDCHLAAGATLDDLANEMVRENRVQQEAYARMSRRYFRCVGIIKSGEEKPATPPKKP
jgi:hypothetical protein